MRAVKGNKEYTIDDTQKKGYQDMGFDILDDEGEVIACGRGKTVPYDDYVRAVTEIEALRRKVAEQERKIEVMEAGVNVPEEKSAVKAAEEDSAGKKAEESGTEPAKKAGNRKAGE